ncbi:MAG: flagellar protein FlgN [Clostridiales bacterium]
MELQKKLENLYLILNEEFKLYKYICNISDQKTQIIVKGKIKELEDIMKLEKDFVVKIEKLEELRERLVQIIAKKIEINADKINITTILKSLKDTEIKLKLKNIQNKTIEVIQKLKNINEINSKLIKNSIDYVDFSINILSNDDEGNNNYGNTGSINKPKKRVYFDRRY